LITRKLSPRNMELPARRLEDASSGPDFLAASWNLHLRPAAEAALLITRCGLVPFAEGLGQGHPL
jgi:hypothetical protein